MTTGRFLALLAFCGLSAAAHARDADVADVKFYTAPVADPVRAPEGAVSAARVEAAPTGERLPVRPEEEVRAIISRRLETIADISSEEGFRSNALIDDLGDVATLYQELGDHLRAIGALEWALDVNRVHNGLHTLDQAGLLEQMIVSRSALEDYGAAASLEERLITLTRRNANDPRVPPILVAAADRRMSDVDRLLEDESTAQLTYGFAMSADASLEPARRAEALAALRSARRLYAQATAAAVRIGGYQFADLLELEERMLDTYYLERSHPELSPGVSGRDRGREAWLCYVGEHVIENHVGNVARFPEQSRTALAEALIRLGDWRLLCSANEKAVDTYRSAYESLLEAGLDADRVTRLLPPNVPVALPAFRQLAVPDETPQQPRGYVDVSFVVGAYGSSRGIRIVESSPGTPEAVEKRLKAHIARTRFRPLFADGEPVRSERVAVRYYYDY